MLTVDALEGEGFQLRGHLPRRRRSPEALDKGNFANVIFFCEGKETPTRSAKAQLRTVYTLLALGLPVRFRCPDSYC